MPLYIIKCPACSESYELLLSVHDMKEMRDGLPSEVCSECGHTGMKLGITKPANAPTGAAGQDAAKRARFKKRNKRLAQLPPSNKERMTRFMNDFNVKRDF